MYQLERPSLTLKPNLTHIVEKFEICKSGALVILSTLKVLGTLIKYNVLTYNGIACNTGIEEKLRSQKAITKKK